MNEIFLVQCEYTRKDIGQCDVSQAGYSTDYQKAKTRLHECIAEEVSEGNVPEGFNGWNDQYEDMFCYETETTKMVYYVCSVDVIE